MRRANHHHLRVRRTPFLQRQHSSKTTKYLSHQPPLTRARCKTPTVASCGRACSCPCFGQGGESCRSDRSQFWDPSCQEQRPCVLSHGAQAGTRPHGLLLHARDKPSSNQLHFAQINYKFSARATQTLVTLKEHFWSIFVCWFIRKIGYLTILESSSRSEAEWASSCTKMKCGGKLVETFTSGKFCPKNLLRIITWLVPLF